MHEPVSTLRTSIKSAMTARGLSIGALAEISGVPRGNLSPYLAGTKHLRSDSIDRIIDALGIELRFEDRPEGVRLQAKREKPPWAKGRRRG